MRTPKKGAGDVRVAKRHSEDDARLYGEIKDNLRRKGRPIPENDVWIAATALRRDLTLVTRDSHFEHVADLRVERW